MSTDKRLTTDRFYGGTENRLTLLAQVLSYVQSGNLTETEVVTWIVEYTTANSRDAVGRHLNFLDAIELIDISPKQVQIGSRGQEWLTTLNNRSLFEALQRNVAGFDVILRALAESPQSDEDLMNALNDAGPFNMNSPGVATRHREWLEVLGYTKRVNGTNKLTPTGEQLAAKFLDIDDTIDVVSIPDNLQFKPGQKYSREKLHDVYGGQRYRGIATPANVSVVFLFTGDSGAAYGYQDEFQSDGNFLYTGEGRQGDMTMDGGNAAIRSHQSTGEELHLFENTDEAWIVKYVGQFNYVDYRIKELHDENGDLRDGIRFELSPIGEIAR